MKRSATKVSDSYLVPIVVETSDRGERSYDIYSRLLKDRIIFVNEINEDSAGAIIAQLFFLDNEAPDKPITMYINSRGGLVTSGLAIYDVMQSVRPPIHTICVGLAASMGAVLLSGGTAGKRATLLHSTHMVHQASGGAQGDTEDIEIEAKEIRRLQNDLVDILAKHCNKPREQVEIDIKKNNYMNAQQAVEYGLVDKVLVKIGDKNKKKGGSNND